MRVLLDANVFISYLLHPRGTIGEVLQAALEERYTLLLPEPVQTEFVAKVAEKPYLADRITRNELQALISALAVVAETIAPITQEIPAVTRDPRDDYLIAYAAVGEADCLVTGDTDLLILEEVAGIRLLTPAEFLELLE